MHATFKRLEWKFTACSQVGRVGPTQEQCDAAYESTNLKRLVQVRQGIQEWLAPIRLEITKILIFIFFRLF